MDNMELIVIDDYLDEAFLKEISEDKGFWKFGYRWWDGWWSSPIEDNRHRLIKNIWGKVPSSITLYGGPIAGFEHWVGITNPDTKGKTVWNQRYSLPPHMDKDEEYWYKHPLGKFGGNDDTSFKHPVIGTIFYVEEPVEGGYLRIWDEHFKDINENTMFESIKPKRNRLIIFDASKTHAVTEVTKGERKAIAINIWSHIPEEFK